MAKLKNIDVKFTKENEFYYKIDIDNNRKVRTNYIIKNEFDSYKFMKDEIFNCLKFQNFLAALSLTFSLLALVYETIIDDNINNKQKFIEFFDTYYNVKNNDTSVPYINGKICYELKNRIQNYCDDNINRKYEDFKIDKFSLIFEDKNNFPIYECFSNNFDNKESLELKVNDFCNFIIETSDTILQKYSFKNKNHTFHIKDLNKSI